MNVFHRTFVGYSKVSDKNTVVISLFPVSLRIRNTEMKRMYKYRAGSVEAVLPTLAILIAEFVLSCFAQQTAIVWHTTPAFILSMVTTAVEFCSCSQSNKSLVTLTASNRKKTVQIRNSGMKLIAKNSISYTTNIGSGDPYSVFFILFCQNQFHSHD